MAVATPPRPDQAPMARARSSLANEAWRMASDPGVSRAPPTPCRARPAIRTPASGATAHTQRRQREPHHPDDEDPPAAVPVAQRPPHQEQTGQGDEIGGHHPLEARDRHGEVAPDGRQGDAHHRGVDGRHRRAEHGGGQDPAAGTARESELGGAGGRRSPRQPGEDVGGGDVAVADPDTGICIKPASDDPTSGARVPAAPTSAGAGAARPTATAAARPRSRSRNSGGEGSTRPRR